MEALVDLISLDINYKTVLSYILIYMFSLWVLFCLWVFFDAKRRYTNKFLPFVFFVAVLILNFPALVFYLIVRPEEDEGDDEFFNNLFGNVSQARGGIDVPLVNFVGDTGNVEFSFHLRLNKTYQNQPHDMKINVEMDNNKNQLVEKIIEEAKEISNQIKTEAGEVITETRVKKPFIIKRMLKGIKNMVSFETEDQLDEEDSVEDNSNIEDNQNSSLTKDKNKK